MRRELYPRFATAILLLLTFTLALTSAVHKSPTMDEQNHIGRGIAYLGTGDPRLSIEHPPLVNSLSALPVHHLLHPKLPLDESWEGGEWYSFADKFLWKVNADADRIVFLARLPIIGLTLALVALVFRWGNELFGGWGAALAAIFCALDPNILAHGRLATTDLGSTFFVFLAAYALWRAVRQPVWSRIVMAGLALGLALSAKMSALAFGPILAFVILLDTLLNRPSRRTLKNVLMLWIAMGGLGLFVLWAIYGFQIGPLGDAGPIIPAAPYVKGVSAILGALGGGRASYLLGEYSSQGWWYYFPVAFAVKTPVATLLGLVLATGLMLRRPCRDDLFIVIPPLAYFAISMTTSVNIGFRHLLPILPFLALHIGRIAAAVQIGARSSSVPNSRSVFFSRIKPVLGGLLAVAIVASALFIYPDFLAFFNVFGGGPENGWRVLVDSNIDWGQDLKNLKKWMADSGTDYVRLSWFGSAYPEAYGINHELLPSFPHNYGGWESMSFDPQNPLPGTYVISVSNLVGLLFPDHELYGWFRAREPDAKIGYSLFVYRVPEDG